MSLVAWAILLHYSGETQLAEEKLRQAGPGAADLAAEDRAAFWNAYLGIERNLVPRASGQECSRCEKRHQGTNVCDIYPEGISDRNLVEFCGEFEEIRRREEPAAET